jgi:hypothetical protein
MDASANDAFVVSHGGTSSSSGSAGGSPVMHTLGNATHANESTLPVGGPKVESSTSVGNADGKPLSPFIGFVRTYAEEVCIRMGELRSLNYSNNATSDSGNCTHSSSGNDNGSIARSAVVYPFYRLSNEPVNMTATVYPVADNLDSLLLQSTPRCSASPLVSSLIISIVAPAVATILG